MSETASLTTADLDRLEAEAKARFEQEMEEIRIGRALLDRLQGTKNVGGSRFTAKTTTIGKIRSPLRNTALAMEGKITVPLVITEHKKRTGDILTRASTRQILDKMVSHGELKVAIPGLGGRATVYTRKISAETNGHEKPELRDANTHSKGG